MEALEKREKEWYGRWKKKKSQGELLKGGKRGKLLDNAHYSSQQKEAIKKRRTTFPLISNKLYMTSEMILNNFEFFTKQLKHFFKNSTIVDRLGIQN